MFVHHTLENKVQNLRWGGGGGGGGGEGLSHQYVEK